MNLPKMHDNPMFDKFWSHYPNKVGKIAAYKAWNKLAPTDGDTEEIIKALIRQKNSRQWREGYIPNPSTYLNQARFLDEPVAEPKENPSWQRTDQGIIDKGLSMGLIARPGESMATYLQRIIKNIEH